MWNVGAAVRKARDRHRTEVHPFTAGVFCGAMMAQIDLLLDRGHPYSEIANESVIEAESLEVGDVSVQDLFERIAMQEANMIGLMEGIDEKFPVHALRDHPLVKEGPAREAI